MTSSSDTSAPRVTVTLKQNPLRAVLAVGLCALILYSLLTFSKALDIVLFALLILYFSGSCLWLRYSAIKNLKPNYFDCIAIFDAFVVASSVAYYFHNGAVSAIFFLLLAFNALLTGHFTRLVHHTLAYAMGILLSLAFTHTEWNAMPNPEILGLVYLLAIIYLLLHAAYIHKHVTQANQTNEKLLNDQLLLKLRSYKLSRYVTPTVWNKINQGRDTALKTERKRVSVFFSDIEGFSALSEELEAEALTELLKQYFTEMVKIISQHRGTIDKFMGDGIMVLFGDGESEGLKTDCLRCVSMAIEMRKKMRELETLWFHQGIKKPLRIRMGINTGYCTVGSFGTNDYMDYTVLGTHVNLASRLEAAAEAGEILVSHETWSLVKDVIMCRDKGEINVKGFSQAVKVYQVVDFRKDLGKQQSYFEESCEGFSLHLDMEKIKNFDKDRVIEHLESVANKLRDKIIR